MGNFLYFPYCQQIPTKTSKYCLCVGGLMEQCMCNRLPLLPQHCCNTPRAHCHRFLHHHKHTQVTLILFWVALTQSPVGTPNEHWNEFAVEKCLLKTTEPSCFMKKCLAFFFCFKATSLGLSVTDRVKEVRKRWKTE